MQPNDSRPDFQTAALILAAATLLAGAAAAQQRQTVADAASLQPQGSPAGNLPRADYAAQLATREAIAPERNLEMGAPSRAPALLDDAVPRPTRRELRASSAGDTLVESIEEDPFYLGFAGAKYYPSADERLDPLLVAQAARAQLEGRTHTHGFVMFGRRMTPERGAQLEALGVKLLGFHPHYCIKVALPVEQLDAVASLEFVRWVGAPRANQKLHPNLATLAPNAQGRLPLYVDVYESDLNAASTWKPAAAAWRLDGAVMERVENGPVQPRTWTSNGPAQRALEELGLEVREWVEEIRAFRVWALPQHVEQLAELDFVQFIEPDAPPTLAHDESASMIGTDTSRWSFPGNNSGVVSIAQLDSGIDNAHQGLQITGWGWDFTGANNPFVDGCEHGSHVLGTLLGNGNGSPSNSLKGVAPSLARGGSATRAYITRMFDNACNSSGTALATLLSVNRNGFWDGFGNTTKPVLSNNSWGTMGTGWFGTEADARTVDAEVWNYDQTYLFAAGNEGDTATQSIRMQATAKNALTVGSVVNFYAPEGFPNSWAFDSSVGPCGDGRWKPNVVAVGRAVNSIDAGSGNGYKFLEGTSMATPHVAGLAAQISDGFAGLRYKPAGIAALLMSSAESKGGALLELPTDSNLDRFGAGKVSAHKALLGSSDYFINYWTFDATWFGGWTFADFNVPANCRRITVAMSYVEPEASAGASQALINDWDLYIDNPNNGISPAGNSGDYFTQQSSLDNNEVRTLDLPAAGVWRWKVWPRNVNFLSSVKMSVAVTYELNDAGCAPSLDVYSFGYYLKPNQQVDVYGFASNGAGLASGASFDGFAADAVVVQSESTLGDGLLATHTDNQSGGLDVALGDLGPGASRQVRWRLSWPTEGFKTAGAYLDVDNDPYVSDSVQFVVDGTPPQIPSIISTSHTQGVWSNDTTIDYTWTQPADNLSGVQGYSALVTSNGFPGDPGSSIVWGAINSATIPVNSSATAIYLNLRPFDNSGNGSNGFAWAAPLLIDAVAPATPPGLASATHPVNVQQCSTNVTATWVPSFDAHSGRAGYIGLWDTSPTTVPTGAANIAASATSFTQNIGSSLSGRYFHLRCVDNAGNLSGTAHYGPVFANAASVATYCTGKTNSLGCVPGIFTNGVQPSRSAGNFIVSSTNVLNQKFGLLFWGTAQTAAPFQGGTLCVAAPTIRTPSINSGGAGSGNSCSGFYSFTFTTAYMNANGITPGAQIFAQWWMRDPQSPSTTGLSNAVRFIVCQ